MIKRILLASVLVAFSLAAVADQPINFKPEKFFSGGYGTMDTMPILYINYAGDELGATIDINGNDLELHTGNPTDGYDNANEDVNYLNTCGTTNGSLTLTNASCDTWAELVDVINTAFVAGETGFSAVVVGAVASDTITVNFMVDMADAQVKGNYPYAVHADSSNYDDFALTLVPWFNTLGQSRGDGFFDDNGNVRRPVSASSVQLLSYMNGHQDSDGAGTHLIYRSLYEGDNDGSPTQTLVYTVANVDDTVLNIDVRNVPYAATGELWFIVVTGNANLAGGYARAQGSFGSIK